MIFFLLVSITVFAQTLNINDAIRIGLEKNQEIKSQEWQLKQAEADYDQVISEFAPKLEGTFGIGPITKAEGNATRSIEDKGVLGRMLMGKITVTQPLYTWGRRSNYKNAAIAGLHVKQAELGAKESEVRYQIKEAYYGYQFANSLYDFIQGGLEELEKAKKNKKIEDHKTKIFVLDIEANVQEVKKHYTLALEALRLRTGDSEIRPAQEWLTPNFRSMKSVQDYIELGIRERSEFKQLAEGIYAKRSLAKAEKKAALPVLGIFGSYEMADTNVRPSQPGVFAYDPYNREVWTLGIGLRVELQWMLPFAKAAKYNAEAEELVEKEVFAKNGIALEIRKAVEEVKEAEAKLRLRMEAYQLGKQWLAKEGIGVGTGLKTSNRMLEAFLARAETTKSYFQAVFDYQIAWANLSKTVGVEVDPSFQVAP
ncbi:MAG: TolC family protein [Oligoflexia bacterium]|nr:TolC family protein [Oligoflexia bacterium]